MIGGRSKNTLGFREGGASALAHMPRALSANRLNRDKK
jgi:hypothetical protein